MPQVIQSHALPDLREIPALTNLEEKCMLEIVEVLNKYGCLTRFGLTLLHQHFPVDDDEVLLETNDPSDRTLLMRPIKKSELAGTDARITSWRLDTGEPQMACVCIPMGSEHQHHSRG